VSETDAQTSVETCSPLEDLMAGTVIVAGARTPIGRLLGGLKDLSGAELGGVAIKGALDKAGVAADSVD
jgi:acetyl-CoA C-acetyltransferase